MLLDVAGREEGWCSWGMVRGCDAVDECCGGEVGFLGTEK